MRRSLAIASAAAAVSVAAGAPLHAQGTMVDQQSPCMAARAGAGVAMPWDDGSAVWFNPGGMAMSPSAIGLGVALLRGGNTFTYDPGRAPTADDTIYESRGMVFNFTLAYRFGGAAEQP